MKCVRNGIKNCQHITGIGSEDEPWTIPFGTHIFFGRTVRGSSSSGSVGTKSRSDVSQDVEAEADNLARDLIEIVTYYLHEIGESVANNKESTARLIADLSIYIVERDTKVLDHGIKLGKTQ